MSSDKVFENIYKHNLWGFGSGHGSLPKVTTSYRKFVTDFIRENNITSVVDFGCGDWQFSHLIDWTGIQYTGLDIVPGVIKQNKKLYSANNIKFKLTPEDLSDIPTADLLIVKDVLQHLSTPRVKEFLKSMVKKYRYCLITNGFIPEAILNVDIEDGGFRPLDIRNKPFSCRATAVFSFGKEKPTRNLKDMKKYDPWKEVVLLITNN